ncbi:PAS domain-containing protein [Horticoccus sp. 23ND18S-11]|uniref:PAS domain-containing protein n=1 Tax=Horticoccus sp. 23ND18S-11 TaxID=3391832 RepID=UPI0039C917B0
MKTPKVVPRDLPREFRANEMFFSTTDSRGVITAGNEVFTRISGYGVGEIMGRAHNLIRHPDMPRAAFRLVWDYLKQSKRPAAVVKNLARDGCYYWVVALFAPAPGGYLSIRFKPSPKLVGLLVGIYADMLAEEERQLAQGATADAAMDASAALLLAAVRTHGYADYDGFMRDLLCDELKRRDAVLAGLGVATVQTLPDAIRGAGNQAPLRALYRRGEAAYTQLSGLFLRLDEFVALQKALEGKATFVDNLTSELRLAAMNASLASARAGAKAQSLGVVSHYMGNASSHVAAAVATLTTGIRTVSDRLRSVIFNLAAGRLQIEMILGFLHELIRADASATQQQSSSTSIKTLQQVFRQSLQQASEALSDLEKSTREMNPTARDLGRHMMELQVAQLYGAVETTRIADKGDFATVFARIRELIDDTRQQLSGLSDALAQLDAIAAETPAAARTIATCAVEMESQAAILTWDAAPAAVAAPAAATPAEPIMTFDSPHDRLELAEVGGET